MRLLPKYLNDQPDRRIGALLAVVVLGIMALVSRCSERPPPAIALDPIYAPAPADRDSLVAYVLAGAPEGPWVEPEAGSAEARMARTVRATAEWYDVDPLRIARLIYVESLADTTALGRPIRVRAGDEVVETRAHGLGQIVPELWYGVYPECGPDVATMRTQVCYAVLVWLYYRDRFPSERLALLGYNGCRLGWSCDWYADAVMDYP